MNAIIEKQSTNLAGVELTSTGINAPNGLTEDQWNALAQRVAEFESGRAWFLGDLYNLWPAGKAGPDGDENSKRARCEDLGLNYKTMRNNGSVAGKFNMSSRDDKLTFKHYYTLATDDLTQMQREELIEVALDHGKVLSVAALAKERDKMLGRVEEEKPVPEATDATEELIENVLDALPEKTPAKVKTAVKKEVKKAAATLSNEFTKAVQNAAAQATKETREHLREREVKADKLVEQYTDLYKKVDGILTRDEFRFVRGVLHPDRAPADRREEFTRAFRLFNQLEEAVNKWR